MPAGPLLKRHGRSPGSPSKALILSREAADAGLRRPDREARAESRSQRGLALIGPLVASRGAALSLDSLMMSERQLSTAGALTVAARNDERPDAQ
jgi:hypothetical protein